MARATFVKAARKAYPKHGIKKGESYYWWSFRSPSGGGSGRILSKTAPRPSQLTRSEFRGSLLSAEERFSDLKPAGYSTVSEFEEDVAGIKDDLQGLLDETKSKFDNMPEGLQQGDTGQLLENRISELESLISDLDGIDWSEPEDEGSVEKRCGEIADEISGFNWSID